MAAISLRLCISACLCGLVLATAASAEDAAPPAVESPAAAPEEPGLAALVAPAAVRRSYPPVTMAGFSRTYQPFHVSGSDADAAIRAALSKPVDKSMKFRGTSLRAAVSLIRDVHCIPLVVDMASLQDAGIDVDACTIDEDAAGVSLGAAMRILLRPFGLTWTIADEALVVTTNDKAAENLSVVCYPLPRAVGVNGPRDFQSIIDLVQSAVAADTWDTVGGPGAIRLLEREGDPLLVVSQTADIHDEIEHFLRIMHERFLGEFAGNKPVLRVHHVADATARASLADSLVRTCNAALADGGDPQANVTTIGEGVAILSKSPEFHALAAQVVASVAGLERTPGGGGWHKPFGQ